MSLVVFISETVPLFHTRGHVLATFTREMFQVHLRVCVQVLIPSLTHLQATRPSYMTPCVQFINMSLLRVAASCSCNISPPAGPPIVQGTERIHMTMSSGAGELTSLVSLDVGLLLSIGSILSKPSTATSLLGILNIKQSFSAFLSCSNDFQGFIF